MESLPFWELTWLAGTSTIWRCFPVEHWDFPNDHLSFQGCHSFCFHQSYRNNWKVLQGEGTHPTVTRRVTLKSVLSFDLHSTKTMTRWPWYLDLHRESECLHPEFLIRTHACLMYCFFWWYLKNLAEPMWWDACRSHLQISNLVQPAPTVHHSLLDFFQKISFTEHVHIFHYFPHFLVTHTATCLCPPRKRKVVCGLPLLGVHQSGNKSLHNIRIAL